MEQQIQRDGGADDFGQVAGGDGDLGADPKKEAQPAAVVLVAELGQVALGGHADLEREALQQDGHQV